MATAHILANDSQIAETVLMPGDPLRAKFIAEHFLDHPVCYNEIRGMLGYTGTYKGMPISVQGSGMGMPSMGIYSYELISAFGVKNLIRIGTAGSFHDHVKVKDIVLGVSASTDSNYAHCYNLPGTYAPCADFELLLRAKAAADNLGIPIHAGNILSGDVFYEEGDQWWKSWAKMGCLAVEMEAAALYMNAARMGVRALTILTISNHFITQEETTAAERETSFTNMMEIALNMML